MPTWTSYTPSFAIPWGPDRSLSLDACGFVPTYGSLIEGRPTPPLNRRLLIGHRKEAEACYPRWGNVLHGDPVVRDYHTTPGDQDAHSRPDQAVEFLPFVFCHGLFSTSYKLGPDLRIVRLVCSWFQDSYTFSFEAMIQELVRQVDITSLNSYSADDL